VYVDTPHRFKSRSALLKYMGIGLERRSSGSGPERVGTPRGYNHQLKSMILGAAKSAIRGKDNPFAAQYRRLIDEGLSPRLATRTVARQIARVMWGMFKSGDAYRAEQVGVPRRPPER
jgi:transposase